MSESHTANVQITKLANCQVTRYQHSQPSRPRVWCRSSLTFGNLDSITLRRHTRRLKRGWRSQTLSSRIGVSWWEKAPGTTKVEVLSSTTPRWHVRGFSPQSQKIESDYPVHSESLSATSSWYVQGFSPQSRMTKSSSTTPRWHVQGLFSKLKDRVQLPRTQRVFKCYISLACVRALFSNLKDRARSPSRTRSLQGLCLAGICRGSLLKV